MIMKRNGPHNLVWECFSSFGVFGLILTLLIGAEGRFYLQKYYFNTFVTRNFHKNLMI